MHVQVQHSQHHGGHGEHLEKAAAAAGMNGLSAAGADGAAAAGQQQGRHSKKIYLVSGLKIRGILKCKEYK